MIRLLMLVILVGCGNSQNNTEPLEPKEPIVAVIERRGEVIYYKISKINFNQNILKTDMKEFDF